MSKNFSIKAIAAVSGVPVHRISHRAKSLGFVTHRKGYTAEQAHGLIYYQPKSSAVRHESLEDETARLIDTLQRMNAKRGRQTVIAAR